MEDQDGNERRQSHHISSTGDSGDSSSRIQSTDMRVASVRTSTTLNAGLSLASPGAKKALLLGKRSSTRRRSTDQVAGGAIDAAAAAAPSPAAAPVAAGTIAKSESGGNNDGDLTAAATAPAAATTTATAASSSSEPEMEYQSNPLHNPRSFQSTGGLVVTDEGATPPDLMYS